ncbi:hypothetical protein BDY17DRAFT_324736 [Neohortaea acidophila]|uniref:Protein kinase domain-containing protein n=1 Tax=Neohortaea acidophila TaxID=245834 RepID=A0A6A6PRB0_9PEZI|nr:uncharacterized protein BDY17DRAFT_324736 [Neohortaea acidophila]KAF2482455.1 hypothetical protein BDY17DRAFT_324736 [Neohortaea acidophila]
MSSIHADPPPPIVTEPSGINYATGAALGKGGFAICHRAERYDGSKPSGHIVALKIVKTKMEPAKLAQKFVSELQIHSKLSHSNIVTFYRAFSFQTSTYVVLELCPNGSLADMLKKRRYLTLPEIRRYVIQICGAVKYLHHRHIVHRDLKTGNLFLDSNMNVKVGDFGLAALLVTEKEMEAKRRTTMCGTPNYLAPEILEKGKGHNEKVDLWAIGVIAYTLAVGKAPFHSSTKEEIYKKLKSGAFTWPELSATTNQSSDLRNLVSSLLVPEEQRPVPDQIVSQPFFKIAFVPSSIPPAAKEKVPKWPEVAIPTAEAMRRGYSDTWYAICKESGVGEFQEGKTFKLNGGRRVRSIVYDMAQEALAGRQPTMPIPKDVVYTSTVSEWNTSAVSMSSDRPEGEVKPLSRPPSRQLQDVPQNAVADTAPASVQEQAAKDAELMPPPPPPPAARKVTAIRKPARTVSGEEAAPPARQLQEISHNTVASTRPVVADEQVARDAETMPPPPQPAVRKVTAVRRAARTISEEAVKASLPLRVTADEPTPASTVPRVRQRAATASSVRLREPNNSSSSNQQMAPTQQPTAIIQEKSERPAPVKRSADASLARRPRSMKARERPRSPEKPGPFATLDELRDALPLKQTTRRKVEPEVIEIHSDPEPEEKPAGAILSLPPPPQMTKPLPVPRKASEDRNRIAGTDPKAVLDRLSQFRDNLEAALSNTYRSRTSPEDAQKLPFITRWVDYSRKHGMGYVLADGTVGCVLNSRGNRKAPLTHIFVRKGTTWLPRVGQNFEHLDTVPLEVLEDCGDAGIKRKVYKGLGSVKEGPLKLEADRRRILGVLWAKFGRYMCQEMDGEENTQTQMSGGHFIRFYQRIGNVGIWGFADGALQLHFPDHTKLVVSATGTHISATCISPEAAAYLASHADLLPHHVSSREVFADSIVSLLHEGGRVRARIVKANALAEKLTFVLDFVKQWIANGGLGRLDGDVDCARSASEKFSWRGLEAGIPNKKAVDRITVGRHGGDAVVREE